MKERKRVPFMKHHAVCIAKVTKTQFLVPESQ